MNKDYFENLVKAVGSSFYYYSHMKDIDLTNVATIDFEEINNRWRKEYYGDLSWDSYPSRPFIFNTFKPAVDQLVYAVMTATEDEIERRVAEKWNEHMKNLDKG